MKRFLIGTLINTIIVLITKQISDTYLCGGIAGILTVVVYEIIDRL